MKRHFKSKNDNGEKFQFELVGPNEQNNQWFYRVQDPECEDFFEFKVEDFDENYVRIDTMTNHGKHEYKNKGIPEYLIPIVAKELNKKILSSVEDARPIRAEFRTPDAEKFWKRMVTKNKAIYHEKKDRYEFTSDEILD